MIWRYVDMIKLLKVLWGYDLMIKKKFIHVIWTQVNQIWMINYVMHWFSPTIQEKIRDRVIISSYPPCQITLSLCMYVFVFKQPMLRNTKYESGGSGNKLESPLKMFCPESPPCLFSTREPHVLTYWLLTFLNCLHALPRCQLESKECLKIHLCREVFGSKPSVEGGTPLSR